MHTARHPFKRLLLAGVLAGLAVAAQAQPPERAQHDPARMEQRIADRQAKLKTELQITAEQESAWNTFTASMRPVAGPADRPDRAALRAMSTPERIEQMRLLREQRNAAMAQREQATLQFYAALTAEQQKLFDSRSARMGGQGPRGHHGKHHPHHG